LRSSLKKPKNRKTLQLCAQVAQTLSEILQGECGDPILRDLFVEKVVPFPDSTRLLVLVCPSPAAQEVELSQVLEHLVRATAKFRQEVAAAIHRKKVPDLMFRFTDRDYRIGHG